MTHTPAVTAPAGTAELRPDVGRRFTLLLWRIGGVFARPRRLFEQLREDPSWLGPLLVTVIAGILAIVLLPDRVFVEAMEGARTRRGDAVLITTDPAVVAMWERIRLSLGVAVTHPLKAVMLAGMLTLLFGRLLRWPAGFWHYLSITTHAMLISALGALLVLPLQIARADPSLHPSTAWLVPGIEPATSAGRALGAVDLFTLWMVVVLAVGVAVANARRSSGVPVTVLVGIYLATVVGLAVVTG
jgi:hypothetical protein